MNEAGTQTRDPLLDTLDLSGFDSQGHIAGAPAVIPPQPVSMGMAEFVVAQRIPQPRAYGKIIERLKVLASAAGEKWVYGWDVNDKRNNRKVHIEGPTIKLANDLWREFGNCVVDVRVMDQGAAWIFYARFIDLETGANMTRAYQQRKAQNIGMADDQRALDMVLQIGQSKAIRNVIVNALQTLSTFCVEEAKKSTVKKIGENPEAARKFIIETLETMGIDRKRVEAIYGRSANNWTVPDMAKIYAEMRGVADEMILADDVWPVPETEGNKAGDGDRKGEKERAAVPAKAAAKVKAEADAKRQAEADAQKADERKEGADRNVTATGGQPPATVSPAATEKVADKPIVTMHMFDDRRKSLGSTRGPLVELGLTIEMEHVLYKVFEIMEHPGGDGYMVIVSKVLGEEPGSAPQTGTQSPGTAHVTAADPEAGGKSGEAGPTGTEPPAEGSPAPAGRPKRTRKPGGTLFGS